MNNKIYIIGIYLIFTLFPIVAMLINDSFYFNTSNFIKGIYLCFALLSLVIIVISPVIFLLKKERLVRFRKKILINAIIVFLISIFNIILINALMYADDFGTNGTF